MKPTDLVRLVSLLTAAVAAPAVALAQRSPTIAATHVDPAVLAQVCAPIAATAATEPTSPLRITGGQDTQVRESYTQGDFVTINAGRNQGIQIGQEFLVRRVQTTRSPLAAPQPPRNIRTAGWIKVYAVDDDLALATITYSCDAMRVNDYLEPMTLPTPVVPGPVAGTPDKTNYARVVMGNDRRFEFSPGDFFVIDQGSAQGITPGAQFVIYRWRKKTPDNFLAAIGEAVATNVQADSATLSITAARDSIIPSDLVAMRK
jgi:hypothetical protein